MGYRLFDWECRECGIEQENLVHVDFGGEPPIEVGLHCHECECVTRHRRCAVTLTAKYMGETPVVAAVAGGRNDTMGYGRVEPLPQPPKELETKADYTDWLNNKERKERVAKRQSDLKQNAVKRKRAAALKKSGKPLDIRNYRIKGDPKI